MGQAKTTLPDDWHAKLKHYRDKTTANNLEEAIASLVQRGLIQWEQENEELPTKYDKPEHPTWNNEQ